jgi:GAF domain-containing protein
MKEKLRDHLIHLRPWQVILYGMLASVLITDLVTVLVNIWLWNTIRFDLIALGTFNAVLVSAILMLFLLRADRKMGLIKPREDQRNQEIASQRHADEMTLLYMLGGAIASGRNLYDSLAALQTEISKILKVDAFYVGIYDWRTDIISYPISFDDGVRLHDENRRLTITPGLSGAVIFGGKTIYLPDMTIKEVEEKYAPVKNPLDSVQLTFLGIPLVSNGKTFGVLSVQSKKRNAYSHEQIQLLENFAIQAAVAIEKANLLEQLQEELARRNRIEADLLERETILEAITFSAEQFLKTPDWRENIHLVLERLGKVFNASHAYLFERHKGPDGVLVNSLRYEWTAPGQKSDLDNPEYQNAPLQDAIFKRYYQILDSGGPFVGSTSFFTEDEMELMKPSGIKALLELRIVVDGKQWGTLGFDEKLHEREWTPVEVDVIRIASNVLGAAIKRQLDEAALKKELDQRKLLIDELESKNAELERFTYTVSHDLKSPIITIRGFLGFIENDIKTSTASPKPPTECSGC